MIILSIDIIKFHKFSSTIEIESIIIRRIDNKIKDKFLIEFQSCHEITDLAEDAIDFIINHGFLYFFFSGSFGCILFHYPIYSTHDSFLYVLIFWTFF
jgi:hypothetical protein